MLAVLRLVEFVWKREKYSAKKMRSKHPSSPSVTSAKKPCHNNAVEVTTGFAMKSYPKLKSYLRNVLPERAISPRGKCFPTFQLLEAMLMQQEKRNKAPRTSLLIPTSTLSVSPPTHHQFAKYCILRGQFVSRSWSYSKQDALPKIDHTSGHFHQDIFIVYFMILAGTYESIVLTDGFFKVSNTHSESSLL